MSQTQAMPAIGGADLMAAREAGTKINAPRIKTNDPAVAERTAREFEAMFVSAMLQPVFAGVKTGDGFFGGGHGEDAFNAMLVDEYGKSIAKRGGLGIADMVKREILKMQEVS